MKKLYLKLGIKDDSQPLIKIKDGSFYEVNLEKLLIGLKSIPRIKRKNQTSGVESTFELTRQIIDLDANVFLPTKKDQKSLMTKYRRKIGEKHLWQLKVTDLFQDSKTGQYKYTFRASYFNIDAKKAKSLHLKAFSLSK